MAQPITLAPVRGVHRPAYRLDFFRNGNPKAPVTGVDLRSAITIQTSKNMNDLAGTFTIGLKDRAALGRIRAMDTGTIRLRGHYSPHLWTVLKVVVDDVRPSVSADPYSSQIDVVISGRCVAKYTQVTSLFLPVWDPTALLPTALTFGMGDPTNKVKHPSPYAINRYIVRKFTYGIGAHVGMSGVPASRHWLDYKTRFSRHVGQDIPYLQFDEDSVATAFKRLEILGVTEAWIDELGRMVYRRPQWDAPVSYVVDAAELGQSWSMPEGDVDMATYVEVVPAGDPGIDAGLAAALRSGRAPVPSSYLNAGDTTLGTTADPEFVIDTDADGKVTAKGRENHWYRLQRRYGLRPQQLSSPLIFTQAQAQAQAEGLLRFYARMTKSLSASLPGCPELRLGRSIRVTGGLDGFGSIDRTFYVEEVAHDYVEGSHYLTHFTGTHGRDPSDPRFKRLVLPRFDPADLAANPDGGVLDPSVDPGAAGTGPSKTVASFLAGNPTPKEVIDSILPMAAQNGLSTPTGAKLTPANVTAANASHTHLGSASDHAGPPSAKWAADMTNGGSPTPQMDAVAQQLADWFGIPWTGAGLITVHVGRYRIQLIYRYSDAQAGDHFGHVHFGVKVE